MKHIIKTAEAATLDPIQMLWVRGDFSRLELLSLRSFLAQGHPLHLYSYDPPKNLPKGIDVLEASKIVDEKLAPITNSKPFGKGGMGSFSDYFRYQLLYQKGGWWSDLDVVALKPWINFPNTLTASTNEKGYGKIANGFVMRFPTGHPVMRDCISALDQKKLTEIGIDETGPLLLHKVLGPDGVKEFSQNETVFAPIPWNASWQALRTWKERISINEIKQRMRRPHLSMRFSGDTVAAHLWNETWRAAGLDKNKIFPSSCLYEKWQKEYNT